MTLINDCEATSFRGKVALITTICRKFAKVADTTMITESRTEREREGERVPYGIKSLFTSMQRSRMSRILGPGQRDLSLSLYHSLTVAKAKLKRMTNLINEHFVFVSQILPDILSRTCELPFAAGSFVFVCLFARGTTNFN